MVRPSNTGPINHQKIQTEEGKHAETTEANDPVKSKNDDAVSTTRPAKKTVRNLGEIVERKMQKLEHASYIENKLMRSNDVEKQPGPPKITTHGGWSNTVTIPNSEHKLYSKNRLMKSGDIEPQPGPSNIDVPKLITVLLLTSLLFLIIGLSSYNNNMTENTPNLKPALMSSTSILKKSLESIGSLLILKNKKKHICIRTRGAYLVILLLIAGDTHPNPGPKGDEACLNCKVAVNISESVACNTCKGWCHLNCSAPLENTTLEQSFEWLCPNPTCTPNHHVGTINSIRTEANRFSTLETCQNKLTKQRPKNKAMKKGKHSKKKPKSDHGMTVGVKKMKQAKRNENCHVRKNQNYLTFLPKISSNDYIGKEYCKQCSTTMRKNCKAVKCKICERMTHARCSDMSSKDYNCVDNKKPKWTCLTCRSGESTTDQKFNRYQCTEDQLPEEWKDIIKGKGKDEEIILHLNAGSILNKEDELREVAKSMKPAAIFVTETWMDDSSPKGTAVPEGYTIIRKDRSSEFKQKYGKRNGGGVAVLIRKGVKINIETKMLDDRNEILWCTLRINTVKQLIGVIYRGSYTDLLKPDAEGNTEMEELLQKILDKNIMLIGDLNCDTLKPEANQDTKKLMELAEEYQLKQLIDKPTRFCDSTATIIDHIWVRDDKLIRKAGTCRGLSDHCGIYCYIRAKTNLEEEEITCRSYRSFNSDNYREDVKKYVKESEFRDYMKKKDLNTAFNCWLESLQKAANKHAPFKTFKPKSNDGNLPWINSELQEIAKTKNMHLKLYRLYHEPEDKERYKAAKNKQTHLKRKLKREYYTKKINEYIGDPRKMWSILKDVTNYNYHEDITPDIINTDTANRFNKFFATVGIEVQKKLNIIFEPPILNPKGIFHFQPETTEKIEQLINRIKPKVATGIDELPARLIKEATPVIVEDLKDMVNLSYETKTFPDQLKVATVKAIHKKGENNDPAQYRPVSILTIISKIFERSAVDQLVTYYNLHSLLNPRQHAYRKFHSTTTSLFELTERIKKCIDNGNLVALAALDLSKAFDSLAHDLILKKLDDMGLNENATSWIQSYLSNRKQLVKFGKIRSNIEKIESGVPQGSILGPLLFITCTNDIYSKLAEYEIFTYADDMQIVIEGKKAKELGRKLETAIQKANEYYNNNSLLCNPTKTEVILLGTKKRLSSADQLEVEVTNGDETKIVTSEESLKLLGIHIDQTLDWNKQSKLVKQRAVNSIRNLHRVNDLIPMKQKRVLYTSLVTPHFSYADIIWNGCGIINNNKIQQAQNFAAKSMLGVSKYTSSTEALKKLGMIPLAHKRKINLAVHVKKSLEGRAPENIQQMYKKHLSNAENRAATKTELNYPKHKLQQYQNGSLYTSIKAWNSLPVDLRNHNMTTFKKNLQTHMTKQYLKI